MSTDFDVSARPALVTGASSGLGRHFAQTLAARGAPVALAARRLDRLEALAADIEARGGRALAIEMDVTSSRSVDDGIARAERSLGALHIVVNNSGIARPTPFLDIDDDAWSDVLDTNLNGAFSVARAAARAMVASGTAGSIINIASIYAFRHAPQVASYAASKAALVQLTGAMALELARHGIRVNAIAPGYVETEMNREFFASDAGRAMIKRVPQRRLGRVQDLDGALLLLASDAGGYMTGATIVVDGGHLLSSL